jgi:hypothetical protein
MAGGYRLHNGSRLVFYVPVIASVGAGNCTLNGADIANAGQPAKRQCPLMGIQYVGQCKRVVFFSDRRAALMRLRTYEWFRQVSWLSFRLFLSVGICPGKKPATDFSHP